METRFGDSKEQVNGVIVRHNQSNPTDEFVSYELEGRIVSFPNKDCPSETRYVSKSLAQGSSSLWW